jgi:hypothetical protein
VEVLSLLSTVDLNVESPGYRSCSIQSLLCLESNLHDLIVTRKTPFVGVQSKCLDFGRRAY